jgi:hypothetical protein
VGEALWVGSTEDGVAGWWCSPVNRGGSRQRRVERAGGAKAVEAERKFPGPTCAFYSRARRWRSVTWQQKQWWGHGLDAGAQSGHQRSDKEADRQVPRGLIFSQNFQKRFNF